MFPKVLTAEETACDSPHSNRAGMKEEDGVLRLKVRWRPKRSGLSLNRSTGNRHQQEGKLICDDVRPGASPKPCVCFTNDEWNSRDARA